MLNKGKIGAALAVGVGRGIPSVDQAADQIAAFMQMEGIIGGQIAPRIIRNAVLIA